MYIYLPDIYHEAIALLDERNTAKSYPKLDYF